MSDQTYLNEFATLEDDPSLKDDFRVYFEREVPFEIRNQPFESEEPGELEPIRVKILVQAPNEEITAIRVELSREVDLFFHYIHLIDQEAYTQVQEKQKLMVSFAQYPEILARMFNNCLREPHSHIGIFTYSQEHDEARLDFIQNMEYKYVELMSCSFLRTPEEIIREQITFRYNSLKQKNNQLQSRLHEIYSIVKTKNPSLLLQFQKNHGGGKR